MPESIGGSASEMARGTADASARKCRKSLQDNGL